MNRSLAATAAAFAIILTLAGCTAGAPTDAETTAPPAAEETSTPSPESVDVLLTTADSPLGEIVVDGIGVTVYMFDNDTQGATSSTCEGQCAANWPAVTTEAEEPEVEGVTGEVGTITGVDGAQQVTLNGWPLYYFIGDEAAGDVNGQGVNEVWWVLTPAGERMAG